MNPSVIPRPTNTLLKQNIDSCWFNRFLTSKNPLNPTCLDSIFAGYGVKVNCLFTFQIRVQKNTGELQYTCSMILELSDVQK